MYDNFLMHSCADGHLGCRHVLAIVNSAAVNTGVPVHFSLLVSSEYMPSSGISGSFISSFFKKSPYCSPGVGNGNPLQYSCLENPRDRGAWWAAVYGVTQSQTRLTRLSSSSSILFSIVVLSVCIPTTSVRGFPFLHTFFSI